MNTKRIFLDNYELCKKEDANLIIIPAKDSDGNSAPEIYYKRIEPYWLIKSVSKDSIWDQDLQFSTKVDQDTYNKMVDWWFDGMTLEYKNKLLDIAEKAIEFGFDVAMSVNKARNKLKIMDKQSRKSYFSKFLIDWVSVGCARFINKQKNNSIYS